MDPKRRAINHNFLHQYDMAVIIYLDARSSSAPDHTRAIRQGTDIHRPWSVSIFYVAQPVPAAS
jgi:3-methyladenine DNA glycosylase AlkC